MTQIGTFLHLSNLYPVENFYILLERALLLEINEVCGLWRP
jgi:hypothetical protein